MPKPAGAPQPISAEDRAAEIMKVQRDIARRRRKRLILLATRLTFFVLLPTLLVSFYFYRVATPMYATHSEFIIQKAESGAGAGRRARRPPGRLRALPRCRKASRCRPSRKPRGDAAPR
jgi:hypothetical protein